MIYQVGPLHSRLRLRKRQSILCESLFAEEPAALRSEKLDFVQHHLDVFPLLFEDGAAALQFPQKFSKLTFLIARNIVQLEQLSDFVQAETQSLAAERELEADTIAICENTTETVAFGIQEPLVFVVPYRASGDTKFFGQLRNTEGRLHCAAQ
jgi:hypothetical protein